MTRPRKEAIIAPTRKKVKMNHTYLFGKNKRKSIIVG